jgi:hypothetical protein
MVPATVMAGLVPAIHAFLHQSAYADDLCRGEVLLPGWTEIILFNDGKGSKGETCRK